MGYNSQQKLRDNISAIRLALEWKKGQLLSDADIDALKRYAGFGGLKAVLFPNAPIEEWIKLKASDEDLKLYPQIVELHQLLQKHFDEVKYRQVVDSIKNSILTAFYTPAIVPQTLFEVLKQKGLEPRSLYEPSSGSGIFVMQAAEIFPGLKNITSVEKDILSGRVLTALGSSIPIPVSVNITGFENTPDSENGKYDLITSNIPFGNFRVYDKEFNDESLTGKIHNYFFAKGLDKIADGGLLAYITTDGFLNNPSNQSAREYVFRKADFISLTVMPDNLMKDTGNTEAPSHLLIVQKNESKQGLSAEEKYLLETIKQENEFGSYHLNSYIHNHPEIIAGDEVKAGKNQYGNAHQSVWQHGDINDITEKLSATIGEGIEARFDKSLFQQAQSLTISETAVVRKQLTFLPAPENKSEKINVQLGLFDSSPAENINRAISYVNELDATVVQKETARIISMVRTTSRPEHESIVLITAKAPAFKQYVYKLYSNVEEINFSTNWKNAAALTHELQSLSHRLQEYGYDYLYEGDKLLQPAFGLERNQPELFTNLKPFYKEGTLVIHNGEAGSIGNIDNDFKQATFQPFLSGGGDKTFYEQYINIRDSYLELTSKEASVDAENIGLRNTLKESYEKFVDQFTVGWIIK